MRISLSFSHSLLYLQKNQQSAVISDIHTTSDVAHYLHKTGLSMICPVGRQVTRGDPERSSYSLLHCFNCSSLPAQSSGEPEGVASFYPVEESPERNHVSGLWYCLPHWLRTLALMWGKTWLFLVRERGLIVEEEAGSLTSGSKQGFWKVSKIRGTLGVFCHKF